MLLRIQVTAGSDIEFISTFRVESEVLLAPGTKLKIKRLKPASGPWFVVDAEQVGKASCQERRSRESPFKGA